MFRDLEYRVCKLERALYRSDEFFDLLDNPSHEEENALVNKLCNRYTSLRSLLKKLESKETDDMFHVELSTHDGSIKFVIYTNDDRDEMACNAYKNGKLIGKLNKFHLYNDLNTVAKFILQILNSQ